MDFILLLEAEETVRLWESNVIPEENVNASFGTQRLIQTACKAFHHKGYQQSDLLKNTQHQKNFISPVRWK